MVLIWFCLVCEKVQSKGRTTYNEVRWLLQFNFIQLLIYTFICFPCIIFVNLIAD